MEQSTLPTWHFLNGNDDILFVLHRECLELARLVFRQKGHEDLSLFVQALIYQRRKNLKEMPDLRLPDHTKQDEIDHLEAVPPAGIEWGNQYYGLSRYYCDYGNGDNGPEVRFLLCFRPFQIDTDFS